MIASIDCKLPAPSPVCNFQWPTGISLHTFLVHTKNNKIYEPFSFSILNVSLQHWWLHCHSLSNSRRGCRFSFGQYAGDVETFSMMWGGGFVSPLPRSVGDITFYKLCFSYSNSWRVKPKESFVTRTIALLVATTTTTVVKKALKKWICVLSNLIASIWKRLIR